MSRYYCKFKKFLISVAAPGCFIPDPDPSTSHHGSRIFAVVSGLPMLKTMSSGSKE
jgi:hypothetical protein